MRRFFKWLGLGILAVVIFAAGYATTVLFLNPSLHTTIDKQGFWQLIDNPEQLTQLGAVDGTFFDFHSGELNDASWEKIARDRQTAADNLAEIRAYDPADLKGQEALTYEVLSWTLDSQLRYAAIPWVVGTTPYPVNQNSGAQNNFPRFMQSQHVVRNSLTARNYVKRLEAVGVKFDQIIGVLHHQAELGALPPTFVFEKVVIEMTAFTNTPVKENQLYTDFVAKLEKLDMDEQERAELSAGAEAAIKDVVYPAYQRLTETLKELLPQTKPEAGIWARPQGDQFYAIALRQMTTTELTPQQVHDIGLAEVARITAEADTILQAQGLTEGTVGERLKALGEDPRFQWPDSDEGRAQILAEFTRIIEAMKSRLPEVFAVIPPQPVEVQRVPVFAQAGASGAYYSRAALDGSRPARVFVNLRFVNETPKWSMKTLMYHEGIPGHHFQIATTQNLDLPLARTNLSLSAYTEGWALYAERLASEMGVYKDDPFGDLGRLQAELFRATRLVVDTGIHYKRWTREQAIAYMVATTGMVETDVTGEIERYIVNPGQACAYKMGMLKILELRDRAKAKLGAKFDLKAFHSVVLDNGPLPLTILEKVVDRWIAEQQGA
ncbi:hypothetical protein sos41_35000 [Alphaproteobacteria bacterium SO-S41]|nr:hypothetical protein sos41_35000 [Alphaproteobacteria bacterium SO-S41]